MKKYFLIAVSIIFILAISCVASEEIENVKTQIDLKITAEDLGDILEVHVALPQDAQGTVEYSINGNNYTINVDNGDANLSIPNLDPGNYIIKANYSGDDKYLDILNQTEITIEEVNNTTGPQNASGDVENKTDDVNGTTGPQNASGDVENTSKVNNTVVIIDNHTDNNTTINNTTINNNTTNNNVTPAKPVPPKKPQPNNPNNLLNSRTGLPIILVIIALAIIVVLRKYKF